MVIFLLNYSNNGNRFEGGNARHKKGILACGEEISWTMRKMLLFGTVRQTPTTTVYTVCKSGFSTKEYTFGKTLSRQGPQLHHKKGVALGQCIAKTRGQPGRARVTIAQTHFSLIDPFMPTLIPRPTHKRFLQTNWLHRWLNTPSTRAGLALAHAHHPAMVRHATIQRQRTILPVTVVVPKEPMAGGTNAAFAQNDINADA